MTPVKSSKKRSTSTSILPDLRHLGNCFSRQSTWRSSDGSGLLQSRASLRCRQRAEPGTLRLSSAGQTLRACSFLFAMAVIVGPAHAAPTPVPARCDPSEEQLFACSIGAKSVAVCASRGWSASAGYVQYRYGATHEAELVLPAQTQPPASSASAGVLALSNGGGAWLRFRSGAPTTSCSPP